jgi:hypothetical protein
MDIILLLLLRMRFTIFEVRFPVFFERAVSRFLAAQSQRD